MIHRLTANHQSFHPVNFTMGLNVIVAERSETSTEKDTRNGVGKTTLLEILDFCLGSNATKGKGLMIEPLQSWAFTLDISIGGNRVKATRAVADPNRIVIEGPTDGWAEKPDQDDQTGEFFFKKERWRTLLGWAFFDLPRSTDQLPYKPSYRSLISYFLRLGPDAYTVPFRHFRQQKTWDIQLHIAYLLGMNWEYAARWQALKDQEEGTKAIEKAIKTGVMERAIGSIGELEAQYIQLEQEAAGAKKALDTFKVHPQYESVQEEADKLTTEIHELANRNVVDRRRLKSYEESIKKEKPPGSISLNRLYEEAGLTLPDTAKRTLEEAKAFHRDIISNRREFLQSEITRIRQVIADREVRIREKTEVRAKVMQVLETHGALQEMTLLRGRYVALQEALERVKARLIEMKSLKASKREVKAAKDDLVQLAERDHEERRDKWSEVIRFFNEHSQALYKSPGTLVIDVDNSGYKYQVHIERSGSEGIGKMKIFCFDLAVLQFQLQNGRGIDFLVHDTLMYDSVDARQRALAFERAHEITDSIGGQYICTINSDMIPEADFTEGFDFQQYVRLRLSDVSPADSLLGIRFERPDR